MTLPESPLQRCYGHYLTGFGVALQIGLTTRPAGLVIAGDVDESTRPHLAAALRAVAAEPGPVHISLARVVYCDLAGLRAILALTKTGSRARPDSVRRVVLLGTPPHLQAMLRITGWLATPGLVVREREAGPAGQRRPGPSRRSYGAAGGQLAGHQHASAPLPPLS